MLVGGMCLTPSWELEKTVPQAWCKAPSGCPYKKMCMPSKSTAEGCARVPDWHTLHPHSLCVRPCSFAPWRPGPPCSGGCDHSLAGPVLSTELTQWHSLVCGEHEHTPTSLFRKWTHRLNEKPTSHTVSRWQSQDTLAEWMWEMNLNFKTSSSLLRVWIQTYLGDDFNYFTLKKKKIWDSRNLGGSSGEDSWFLARFQLNQILLILMKCDESKSSPSQLHCPSSLAHMLTWLWWWQLIWPVWTHILWRHR